MNRDRRSESRFNSKNLISYVCLDEDNKKYGQGMGRTLNISEGGILLETHVLIDPESTISLTIALEEELVDFNGRIAFSNKKKDGKYETGVNFIAQNAEKRRFLRHYITVFKEQMMSNRGDE
jgi:c-di-GMP-binding flagellar brake protein YcgR